jgi:hypothetical protein
MKFWFILLCIFVTPLSWGAETIRAPAAASAEIVTPAAVHQNRNYPGGRDDEDLKVQETLVTPTVKIDRRTIESKVLKISPKKLNSDEPEATEQ